MLRILIVLFNVEVLLFSLAFVYYLSTSTITEIQLLYSCLIASERKQVSISQIHVFTTFIFFWVKISEISYSFLLIMPVLLC